MGRTNQRAAQFLQSLDIPTVKHGGFDQEQVYATLKQLTGIYEDIFAEQDAKYAQMMGSIQKELDSRNQAIAEMQAGHRRELEALQAEQSAKAAVPTATDPGAEYTGKLEELAQAVQFIKSQQASILAEAEYQRVGIMKEAQEASEKIRQEVWAEALAQKHRLMQEISAMQQEKQKITEFLDSTYGKLGALLKETSSTPDLHDAHDPVRLFK